MQFLHANNMKAMQFRQLPCAGLQMCCKRCKKTMLIQMARSRCHLEKRCPKNKVGFSRQLEPWTPSPTQSPVGAMDALTDRRAQLEPWTPSPTQSSVGAMDALTDAELSWSHGRPHRRRAQLEPWTPSPIAELTDAELSWSHGRPHRRRAQLEPWTPSTAGAPSHISAMEAVTDAALRCQWKPSPTKLSGSSIANSRSDTWLLHDLMTT